MNNSQNQPVELDDFIKQGMQEAIEKVSKEQRFNKLANLATGFAMITAMIGTILVVNRLDKS